MHVLLFLLILLAFPILEIWLLIELADRYGWALLGYLVIVAILGWRLILDEKFLIFGRLAQTMAAGGTPAAMLLGSAKNMIAGILLIIPGVITDIIAAVLLLIPSPKPLAFEQEMADGFSQEINPDTNGGTRFKPRKTTRPGKAANDDVIEGEFRRED